MSKKSRELINKEALQAFIKNDWKMRNNPLFYNFYNRSSDRNSSKNDKEFHAEMKRVTPEAEMDNTIIYFNPNSKIPVDLKSTNKPTHRQKSFANDPTSQQYDYVIPITQGIMTLPFGVQGIKTLGKGLLTWAPKLSFSSAYRTGIGLSSTPTVGAITSDALLGAVTTAPGATSIIKDGVNLGNVSETTLGLLPIFAPTYKTVANGVKSTNKAVKEIKLTKELNKSIKNTKFNNIPVYHTTTYTGNDLRPWSNNEWGLHVTPDSSTALRIAANVPKSHIKEGIFTYTNNTTPIRISDLGSFQRGFGDFDYTGVEQYNFLQPRQAENMLAGSRNPSYVYNNMYEHGGDSFAITNPKDAVFSKNNIVEREIPLKIGLNNIILPPESLYIHSLEKYGESYLGQIGDDIIFLMPNKNLFSFKGQSFNFDNNELYLKEIKKLHDNYVKTLPELQKQLYINMNTSYNSSTAIPSFDNIHILTKARTRDIIDNFYKSEEYKNRFIDIITNETDPILIYPGGRYHPENQYNKFISNLERTHNNYDVGIFNSNRILGEYQHNPARISLNTRSFMYDPNTTIHHEFGHGTYSYRLKNDDEWSGAVSVISHNDDLIGDASKHLLPNHNLSPHEIEYYTDPEELRLRIIPVVEEMFENGWTIEQAYENSKSLQLARLKDLFNKDYIIKLLGGMLSTTPLILNKNESNPKKKL